MFAISLLLLVNSWWNQNFNECKLELFLGRCSQGGVATLWNIPKVIRTKKMHLLSSLSSLSSSTSLEYSLYISCPGIRPLRNWLHFRQLRIILKHVIVTKRLEWETWLHGRTFTILAIFIKWKELTIRVVAYFAQRSNIKGKMNIVGLLVIPSLYPRWKLATRKKQGSLHWKYFEGEPTGPDCARKVQLHTGFFSFLDRTQSLF